MIVFAEYTFAVFLICYFLTFSSMFEHYNNNILQVYCPLSSWQQLLYGEVQRGLVQLSDDALAQQLQSYYFSRSRSVSRPPEGAKNATVSGELSEEGIGMGAEGIDECAGSSPIPAVEATMLHPLNALMALKRVCVFPRTISSAGVASRGSGSSGAIDRAIESFNKELYSRQRHLFAIGEEEAELQHSGKMCQLANVLVESGVGVCSGGGGGGVGGYPWAVRSFDPDSAVEGGSSVWGVAEDESDDDEVSEEDDGYGSGSSSSSMEEDSGDDVSEVERESAGEEDEELDEVMRSGSSSMSNREETEVEVRGDEIDSDAAMMSSLDDKDEDENEDQDMKCSSDNDEMNEGEDAEGTMKCCAGSSDGDGDDVDIVFSVGVADRSGGEEAMKSCSESADKEEDMEEEEKEEVGASEESSMDTAGDEEAAAACEGEGAALVSSSSGGMEEGGDEDEGNRNTSSEKKCLIFAEHLHTLDVVETLVLKAVFPSLPYARLDGKVSAVQRAKVADDFNTGQDRGGARVLLLTTGACGLGLNLCRWGVGCIGDSDFCYSIDLLC